MFNIFIKPHLKKILYHVFSEITTVFPDFTRRASRHRALFYPPHKPAPRLILPAAQAGAAPHFTRRTSRRCASFYPPRKPAPRLILPAAQAGAVSLRTSGKRGGKAGEETRKGRQPRQGSAACVIAPRGAVFRQCLPAPAGKTRRDFFKDVKPADNGGSPPGSG